MNTGSEPNAKRLLWAGFFAIFASGVGFSVRAGVLAHWARDYGFTQSSLGEISGGGLTGFGVIILLGAMIADKIGYGRLMVFAFIMHILSALLQLCTGQIYDAFGQDGVYWNLFIAMFLFSVANGVCEAVVNPMVATLFPTQKTHYLNILHAGWPGGLIAGGLISYLMNDGAIGSWHPFGKVHWLVQMSLFLVPTFLYGFMVLGQKFPQSEASRAGLSFGTMLKEFLAPVLLLLLVIHALVGYVELGTDSWISKITGSIMGDPTKGLLLFVYTSSLMFALRFVAGPIEQRLTPLGLLCVSGVLGCIGLTLLGNAEGVILCVFAATVYALGKTFLWPTMLAVVSERFPRGGAMTIGAIGGAGMLSAGLLGNPAIGFQQDYYASKQLKQEAPKTYDRYAADKENTFLGMFNARGLNGSKVSILDLDTKERTEEDSQKRKEIAEELDKTLKTTKPSLEEWWSTAKPEAPVDAKPVDAAGLFGGRMALKWTAIVPATMALLYLLLILYFKMTGGYKAIHLSTAEEAAAVATKGSGWTDEA